MKIMKYNTVVQLSITIIWVSFQNVHHCSTVSKCFPLPVKYKSPTKQIYTQTDIPDTVEINLRCNQETESIQILEVRYEYPPLLSDYCPDPDGSCCVKSHEHPKCSHSLLPADTSFCAGNTGNCTLKISQFKFTNKACKLIEYSCQSDGVNKCISRWVSVNYMCSKDHARYGVSVQTNNAPHSLLLFQPTESPETWYNISTKGQPGKYDNEDIETTVTDDSMTISSKIILTNPTTGTTMTNYLIISSWCGFLIIGTIILVFKYKHRCKRMSTRKSDESTGGIPLKKSDQISGVDDSGYEICTDEQRLSVNYEEISEWNIPSQHITTSDYLIPVNHLDVKYDIPHTTRQYDGKSDYLIPLNYHNMDVKDAQQQDVRASDYLIPLNDHTIDVENHAQQPYPKYVITSDYLTIPSILDVTDHVQQTDCHLYESVHQETQFCNRNTESDKKYQQLI